MRRRLIMVALAISTMVAVAFNVPLAVYIRQYQRDIARVTAQQDAKLVTSFITTDNAGSVRNTLLSIADQVQSKGDVVVWLPNDLPLPVRDNVAIAAGPGQTPASVKEIRDSGSPSTRNSSKGIEVLWPIVVPSEKGGVATIVVRVFTPSRVVDKGVITSWAWLAVVALALILTAVAIADRLARAIVKPTKELADVTRRLSAGESDARTVPSGPPEIADVGGAVNNLADRIDELLAAERETLADLSHRLRTPLAALRLDADALTGTEIGDRIMTDISAMEQAVSNVIREVRAPKRAADISCDLIDVARTRCEFWQVLAEDDNREWRVDLPHGAAWVPLKRDDLSVALDALVTNAFTYTPEGSGIRLWVVIGSNEATLTLDDNGPGFPEGFQIKRGESGGTSTGLGLDIAQRTARAVSGRLTVTNRTEGGGRVQLAFPLRVSPNAPRRGGRGGRNGNGSNGSANGRVAPVTTA